MKNKKENMKNYLTEKPTTAKDWFLWAKEAGYYWASQAIKNIDHEGKTHTSICSAVLGAFSWSDTKEGVDFWSDILTSAEAIEWCPIPEKKEGERVLTEAQQSTAEKIKVMQHFVNGGVVEFDWAEDEFSDPVILVNDGSSAGQNWDWDVYDYRIKEEEAIVPTIPFAEFQGKAILLTPQVIAALEKEGIKY